MMNNIAIETLTPVHIGTGRFLNYNTDFIPVNVKNGAEQETQLVVISEEKIWHLLGEEKMDLWLSAIANKENIGRFINTFAPNAKSHDYAKRKIISFSQINPQDTLKEMMHDGVGHPYIPGSSIKGAIRTAILASLTKTIPNKESLVSNFGRVSARKIEAGLFGNDPNNDVFRFIQVGDAYFEKGCEIATRMVNLNISHSNDLMDYTKPQLIEAIGAEAKSSLRLKICKESYDFSKIQQYTLGKLPVQNLQELMMLINQHTKKLVEEEIDYWDHIGITGAEDYVENMQEILDEVNKCQTEESCVLRVGHAIGWRFVTGAWAEKLGNFEDTIVPASRPKNRNYEEYDFPKSRRLDEEGFICGFVKLSIIE